MCACGGTNFNNRESCFNCARPRYRPPNPSGDARTRTATNHRSEDKIMPNDNTPSVASTALFGADPFSFKGKELVNRHTGLKNRVADVVMCGNSPVIYIGTTCAFDMWTIAKIEEHYLPPNPDVSGSRTASQKGIES